MRTVSTAQEDVLTAATYDVKLRVEVENSTGTFVNLSALGGADWVESVDWAYNLDQPVPEIRIGIRRDITGTDSLAPLAEDSSFNIEGASTAYAALLDAGRELKVYTATVARGAAAPASGALDFMAHAEIDEVQWGKSPIQVIARSKIMSQLADRWIEAETVYGDDAGVAIETVMQSIIDDWTDGTITLWDGGSPPSFNILSYRQQKMSVLSALTQLVQLIGWDVREVWDDGTSAFRLKLYEPDRAASTGDKVWTFDASQYYDVNRIDISRADVRNVVSVLYTSSGSTGFSTVTAQDAASITRFGRRWMEIQEGGESSINSSSEANALATAALNDLKDPLADQEIVHPYFWPVELQDYQEYLANDVHYSTDQFWAIYGLRHTLTARETRTRMMVRGKPAGQYLNWGSLGGGIASTGYPIALQNAWLEVLTQDSTSDEAWNVFLNYEIVSSAVTAINQVVDVSGTTNELFAYHDFDGPFGVGEGITKGRWLFATFAGTASSFSLDTTITPLSISTATSSDGAAGPSWHLSLNNFEIMGRHVGARATTGSSSGGASTEPLKSGPYAVIGSGLLLDYTTDGPVLPRYSLHYQVSTAPVSTAAHGDPEPGQLFFQVTSSAP
jgi:hypothetical protein